VLVSRLLAHVERVRDAIVARLASAGDDAGFTLVELLTAMMIIGILMEISVPSYLNLQARAKKNSAQSTLKSVEPGFALWFADHGTYAGMSPATLNAAYGLNLNTTRFRMGVSPVPSATGFCIQYQEPSGSYTARFQGPLGPMTVAQINNCP
jgi:prepilin-type N-terminal cleavage/methylation domain-containing protein